MTTAQEFSEKVSDIYNELGRRFDEAADDHERHALVLACSAFVAQCRTMATPSQIHAIERAAEIVTSRQRVN